MRERVGVAHDLDFLVERVAVYIVGDNAQEPEAAGGHRLEGGVIGLFRVARALDVPGNPLDDFGRLDVRAIADRGNLDRWPLLLLLAGDLAQKLRNAVDGVAGAPVPRALCFDLLFPLLPEPEFPILLGFLVDVGERFLREPEAAAHGFEECLGIATR